MVKEFICLHISNTNMKEPPEILASSTCPYCLLLYFISIFYLPSYANSHANCVDQSSKLGFHCHVSNFPRSIEGPLIDFFARSISSGVEETQQTKEVVLITTTCWTSQVTSLKSYIDTSYNAFCINTVTSIAVALVSP